MCGTDTRKDLNLTPTAESACACCSTDSTPVVPSEAVGTRYGLEGLTCGHCVKTVETAVSAMAGVESATVELRAGSTSSLTVVGDAGTESVRAAVENAGYTLTGS
ncbi:heavy-metal-associated domain-containing protein [Arthrobacter sp. H14-L1]|uniref:heavy-metal-associated domain-containing protein n=1 Tax=Arthrobacter sp. H14-L1 TaxID=2996697 RepID=UPI00226F978E|nr:heavy-metal-associated domain-containing protein [Arthrobacter sp. H14-L1]MCY0906418.1 heavy-metal-associated domain-containing protein [Arthrobacter sp. H14-L1]